MSGSSAAAVADLQLAEVMPAPPGAAPAPLDLISIRTTQQDQCPESRAVAGIQGAWAVVVSVPCGLWACPICGERKAQLYAGVARAGCELATERIRLLTISCPAESPTISWTELGARWNRMRLDLSRQLAAGGRRLHYFGTVELQKRGNPHLHLLLRDSGFIPKGAVHAAGFRAGFGFSDIRQIRPGAGVKYVTKYLHKSAGQGMPKGTRRIRRSRDWWRRPPAIKASWGPDWRWQFLDRDPERVGQQLAGAGYLLWCYGQRVVADDRD